MHRKSIEELLENYLNHQLTHEQWQDLTDRANRDQDAEHATAWFYRLWDEAHLEKPDKKSREAFSQLKQKLALKDDNNRFMHYIQGSSSVANTWLKAFIRYAAVFLLSFGLAWLIFITVKMPVSSNASAWNTVTVANGSRGNLTLEDGTKIWMNSGSKLLYNNFAKDAEREVFLEGEAFFDVQKDNRKPFIVKTSDLKLKVLGTRFNVKSYPSEKITETILVSGKVQIEDINAPGAGRRSITLEPNQKATFYKTSGKLSLQNNMEEESGRARIPARQKIIETVNPELYTSWKDEKLVFNNERLESLVVKMERWFNVNITLKDSLLNDYRYTGKFEKENIEQALKALKLATPLEYQIDKDKITLSLAGEGNNN